MFMSEEILGRNLKSKFYFLNHIFFLIMKYKNRLTIANGNVWLVKFIGSERNIYV